MKFLKGLLYFVLILFVAFLLANIFAPAEKTVERSTTINAPLDKVYSQVANFERWMYWDPWYNIDTSQVREMTGEIGTEGYGYSWKSDHEKVGNGTMAITKYEGKNRFDYTLNFEGMGSSNGYFTFTEENGSTMVTWALISEQSFFMRFMNYLIDGFLGPDFDKGLAKLKEYVETSSDEELGLSAPEPEITMGTVNGVNYVMVREQIKISEGMEDWFKHAYERVYGYCKVNAHAPMGPASALYYTWEPEKDMTDVAAAVPITERIAEEGTAVDTDAGKAMLRSNHIMYKMVGAYTEEAFGSAHEALGKWCMDNNKQMNGPAVEEYVKGPESGVPAEEYVTNIYYFFE